MNPIISIMLFTCGVVLLWKAGDAIHDMGPRTLHWLRISQWITAVGALALVLSPFAHQEPKLHWWGMFLIVVGKAIRSAFERRRLNRSGSAFQ